MVNDGTLAIPLDPLDINSDINNNVQQQQTPSETPDASFGNESESKQSFTNFPFFFNLIL